MRRMIIASLALLGATAGMAQPAPGKQNLSKPATAKQTSPQSGNCVGVVSNLGEKFTVKKIGFTVFQNEENEVPVESWRIDDLVVAKISGSLGKRGAVRRIPYRKEAFASLDTPKLFRNYDTEVGEIVRTIASGTHCSRYVVVAGRYWTVGDSRESIGGIGILYDGVGPLSRVNLYALFSLWLYAGETFTLLKQKAAPSGGSIFLEAIRGPHRLVDKSFWPESSDKAAQDVRLREGIRELVSQGMDATLPELPLTE
jgi:hypothetical protein